jgi:hypothetical protein
VRAHARSADVVAKLRSTSRGSGAGHVGSPPSCRRGEAVEELTELDELHTELEKLHESEEDLRRRSRGSTRPGTWSIPLPRSLPRAEKLTGCDLDEALTRPPLRRESVRCGGGCVELERVQEGHLSARGRDCGL